MSVADLQELEEIKGLVTRGQQLGVLTYAEISGAVSELDLDEADVDAAARPERLRGVDRSPTHIMAHRREARRSAPERRRSHENPIRA